VSSIETNRISSTLSRPAVIGLVLAGLGCAAHIFLLYHFNFTQDDAYISFRYALNYIHGHGLVFNVGERVEGYTNFLWTILLVAGRLAGSDLVLFSQALGAVFGIGTIIILYRMGNLTLVDRAGRWTPIASGICCLILGSAYSFAYWTVSGLETAAFTFMLLVALYAYLRHSGLTAPCLVMATLLRPEGALAAVVILTYDFVSHRRITAYAGQIGVLWLLFLVPFALFKLSYYGSLLPNPFYAKTTFNAQQLAYGAQYAGQFFWHYLAAGVFLVPAFVTLRRMPVALKVLFAFVLIYSVYIILIGGDVLKVHRFFVPVFPLITIIVVSGFARLFKSRILFVFAAMGVLAWQSIVPWEHVSTFHALEKGLTDKMEKITASLTTVDQTDFSIALSTIGVAGYRLMDHTVIDMLGLTDTVIARHPEKPVEGLETTWREGHFNTPYLLSRRPDYILFSTGSKPSAPAERALYLYSSFLNNYRTIAFNFGASALHPVYRRSGPITGEIKRDVDVRFVQNYNQGINLLWNAKDYPGALKAFQIALRYSPEPKFPYLYYYISIAQRSMGQIEASYRSLQEVVRLDDRVYEGHKELYLYEYLMGNREAAQYHRAQVARLVPWYLPRLDSLVTGSP
jgi:arabinofuranosyltransferase